jgi:hypothetical protein
MQDTKQQMTRLLRRVEDSFGLDLDLYFYEISFLTTIWKLLK